MVRHYSDTDSGIEIASSEMSARKRWERHRHLSDCEVAGKNKDNQLIRKIAFKVVVEQKKREHVAIMMDNIIIPFSCAWSRILEGGRSGIVIDKIMNAIVRDSHFPAWR